MPWKYFVLALPTSERWRMNFLCATHFVNWQKAKSLAAWEINIANTFQRDWYAELLMQIYKICCHRLFRTFLISFIWLFCCASGILFTPAVHKNINEPKFRFANMKGESKNKKFHHPSQKTRRWSWLPKKKGFAFAGGAKRGQVLGKNWATPMPTRWGKNFWQWVAAPCLRAMFCFLPIGVGCCCCLSFCRCCCCCCCFSTSGFAGPVAKSPWISQQTRAHTHMSCHSLRPACTLCVCVCVFSWPGCHNFQVTHTACGHVCYPIQVHTPYIWFMKTATKFVLPWNLKTFWKAEMKRFSQ